MQLDTATIAFLAGLIFATQAIAVSVQYRVKTAYHGIGWWLAGTALQALGFILMLTVEIGKLRVLAVIANPSVFLGQIFLYIGIRKFLDRSVHRLFPAVFFAAYLACYYWFAFVTSSIMGRTTVVTISSALVSVLIATGVFSGKKKSFRDSANFTALVFLAYGIFQTAMTAVTLLLPPLASYQDIGMAPIRQAAFIGPILASILWTFGFIIMVNQRLNAENLEKNEKLEIVLKEVHHRIKNNMNTMISLLNLQAGNMENPSAVAALEDAGARMQSMGVLYDKLYQSADFSELSVAVYLPSLIDGIMANFPGNASVHIEKNIDDFILDAKRLQPIGIIINELLTNIMKYAFVGRAAGVIKISAILEAGRVTIAVRDNGNGIPPSVDFGKSTGFGLMLVQELAKQLDGTIWIERGDGTGIVLEFTK